MTAPLPIDDVLPDLLRQLAARPAVVLRAPTGAGKTTRVPPAVLDAGLAGGGQVVMLEPRRVAARAAARRMAAERGGRLGDEVGFHVRFERRASAATRLLVVTEGLLVAMLQRDPFLDGVGVLVFDEFHERNLNSDLALAMAHRVQREVRDDLKLVVMSATLDPAPIAAWLDAAVVESTGRLHPVDVRFLERPDPRRVEEVTAAGVRRALEASRGDVLAFLPGAGEIRRTAERLTDLEARGVALRPLYGELPAEQQDAALRRSEGRRVVLATNVAETSVTVEGVGAVVDSGLVRTLRFDPATGLDRLQLGRVSRDSADQRTGRAGRQGPGLCWRLWTAHDDRGLRPSEVPEIRRVDLAGPLLQLLAWGERDPLAFDWFEAPDLAVAERGLELLRRLGALGPRGLEPAGRTMARLPLHPRLARLLLAGHELGVPGRAALAAALLSERDVVTGERRAAAVEGPSDVLDRIEALEEVQDGGWGETALGPVHRGRARRVLRVGRELRQLAERALGRGAETGDDDALLRALFAAYPDRLARRREPGSRRAVMVGGSGVRLGEESVVRAVELFVCPDLQAGAEARVRLASAVAAEWLPAAAVRRVDEVSFDAQRQRAVGRRQTWYEDLLLDEREVPPCADAAAAALEAAAAEDLERALPLAEPAVAGWLARLRSLAGWMPELGLPRFEERELRDLLPALCAGRRTFADLRRAPLLEVLKGHLDPAQARALERFAPERLEVPSGSRVRLCYEPGQPPVLAVRIQELFGLAETPRVAGGRVPVLLHLLAPNQRPQQITRDLASFWTTTYPEVRKQLRGRYPKHAWPEDPRRATATRRGTRAQSNS